MIEEHMCYIGNERHMNRTIDDWGPCELTDEAIQRLFADIQEDLWQHERSAYLKKIGGLPNELRDMWKRD